MVQPEAGVEALLFVADAPVSVRRLADALDLDLPTAERALELVAAQCESRGVRLQRHGDMVQLVTSPETAPAVEKFLGLSPVLRLSPAALETLAVVAYRQPVTRAQIEQIRGVNADRAIATLLAHGLVEETGRLETVGRPVLFGTTADFLEQFGLTGLAELPPLPEGTG